MINLTPALIVKPMMAFRKAIIIGPDTTIKGLTNEGRRRA